jgi:hypothetical protein
LIAFAFAGGAAFSLWAVTIAPAVAQLTTERTRARAFSLFFGTSIAIGILGGLAAGRMPELLISLARPAGIPPTQAALFCGCALILAALWPAARLRLVQAHRHTRPKYPFSPFVRRFLLSLAGFNLAVGAFNPFFNTFFALHVRASVQEIGALFSAGQVAQVAAILAAPMLLRKAGLVNGVMATQIAAGVSLAALASVSSVWVCAAAYAAYTAFQYMSEPGVCTLLMGRVKADEQNGASSLNFLATFAAHAVASAAAGVAFSAFGYPRVIAVLAALAVVSALLFRHLLKPFETPRAAGNQVEDLAPVALQRES